MAVSKGDAFSIASLKTYNGVFMFCENCGSQLSDNAKFCAKCGNKVILEDFQTPQMKVGASEPAKSFPGRFPERQDEQIKNTTNAEIKNKAKLFGAGCLIIFIFIFLAFAVKDYGSSTDNANVDNEQTADKTENNSDDMDQRLNEYKVYVPTKVWYVVVNEMYFGTEINEVEYMHEVADNGTYFITVDITFINHTNKTQSFSSIWEPFSITCDEGYSFSENIMDRALLKNAFKDGDILPNKQRRGEILFRVNDDITNPVFQINFLGATRRWPQFHGKYKNIKLKDVYEVSQKEK